MSFNRSKAVELLINLDREYPRTWPLKSIVEDVAAQCGLGVLSLKALEEADAYIRNDMEDKHLIRELCRQPHLSLYAPKWADYLLAARAKYPPEKKRYPIRAPKGHIVGKGLCFGLARKGTWSDEHFRAAWGNVKPFGLENAVKPCPFCSKPMRYWCYENRGEPEFKWTVDHVRPHSGGGCVCWFNLKAIHRHCNSSKGKNSARKQKA